MLGRCERRLELSFDLVFSEILAELTRDGSRVGRGLGPLGVISSCRRHAGIEQG